MKRTTNVFMAMLFASMTSISAFAGNFVPSETAPSKVKESAKELTVLSLEVYAQRISLETIKAKFQNRSASSCADDAWEFGTNFVQILDLPDDGWSVWYATNWYYETYCE